ncbi:MAG: circadian clock protein KaiB [Synechococcaceae cyanobacterium]|nr:circadian clock protein KaiB [Synechococcaceae cyanobacterium]
MALRKTYILKLYVAGNTPNSMRALKTLRNILETEFRGVYALKVIDVLKNPQLAEEDKILATPTLAKILPPPVRRIIGDLSDRERVLIGLDLLYEELTEEGFAMGEERAAAQRSLATEPSPEPEREPEPEEHPADGP